MNEDIYQCDGIRGPDRERLISDAISYAMGRTDWSLVEVADRGSYLEYDQSVEVFCFDGRPLVRFQRLTVERTPNPNITRTHYEYEILYEEPC